MNFRFYDSGRQVRNIRWLNVLAGCWIDLVSQEPGGVREHGGSIVYAFNEPVAGHALRRATYTSHSPTHFTWHGEKSGDAKTWNEFMVVQAYKDA